ncbi:T9SS type A sorting domain-containing protein [Psychroserpens sp. MEBiC05023]
MISKRLSHFLVLLIFLIPTSNFSQNLLDTSTWTVGSGSVVGFSQHGVTSENIRELGFDHVNNEVVLWTSVPDVSGGGSDGGFNTSYVSIDNTKTYRFSVWIKKTNSNDGVTFFGTRSYSFGSYHILTLGNSNNTNPYFLAADLPVLNRWYLLVGYVHNKDYSSSVNLGKIYDGTNGEVVQSLTDFKFKSTAINVLHRAYLSYDGNTSDRQYYFDPRIDVVDGNEPSILELLSINENSQLLFAYDNMGSQKQRFYCSDLGCSVPNPPLGRTTNQQSVEDMLLDNIEDSVFISPNPTSDFATLTISNDIFKKIESISIYDINTSLVDQVSFDIKKGKPLVNLSGKPAGIYFVHIHFNDGQSLTKKVIKK